MTARLPLRIGIPMQPSSSALTRRQYVQDDNGDDVWFWYTTAGVIVKYTVFFGIVLLLVGWIIGGRFHAKRRWLLSRYERAQVDPAYASYPQPVYGVYRPVYGGNNGGEGDHYGMHSMPPPVYDPSRPPVYDGPPVGSKVDPVQDRQGQTQTQTQTQTRTGTGTDDDYAPPAGPPPGAR
ncbi:hypothetical protein F5Y03DRAFT_392780 [Xylaria venustula]|nr:hypothetical protein F5Y03DRAFT_392780 [Xylaria venustula]